MSTKVRLRARSALHDLPPIATDDELLAWSQALIAPVPPARRRIEPLCTQPLTPVLPENMSGDLRLSDEELFAEIYERARAIGNGPRDPRHHDDS